MAGNSEKRDYGLLEQIINKISDNTIGSLENPKYHNPIIGNPYYDIPQECLEFIENKLSLLAPFNDNSENNMYNKLLELRQSYKEIKDNYKLAKNKCYVIFGKKDSKEGKNKSKRAIEVLLKSLASSLESFKKECQNVLDNANAIHTHLLALKDKQNDLNSYITKYNNNKTYALASSQEKFIELLSYLLQVSDTMNNDLNNNMDLYYTLLNQINTSIKDNNISELKSIIVNPESFTWENIEKTIKQIEANLFKKIAQPQDKHEETQNKPNPQNTTQKTNTNHMSNSNKRTTINAENTSDSLTSAVVRATNVVTNSSKLIPANSKQVLKAAILACGSHAQSNKTASVDEFILGEYKKFIESLHTELQLTDDEYNEVYDIVMSEKYGGDTLEKTLDKTRSLLDALSTYIENRNKKYQSQTKKTPPPTPTRHSKKTISNTTPKVETKDTSETVDVNTHRRHNHPLPSTPLEMADKATEAVAKLRLSKSLLFYINKFIDNIHNLLVKEGSDYDFVMPQAISTLLQDVPSLYKLNKTHIGILEDYLATNYSKFDPLDMLKPENICSFVDNLTSQIAIIKTKSKDKKDAFETLNSKKQARYNKMKNKEAENKPIADENIDPQIQRVINSATKQIKYIGKPKPYKSYYGYNIYKDPNSKDNNYEEEFEIFRVHVVAFANTFFKTYKSKSHGPSKTKELGKKLNLLKLYNLLYSTDKPAQYDAQNKWCQQFTAYANKTTPILEKYYKPVFNKHKERGLTTEEMITAKGGHAPIYMHEIFFTLLRVLLYNTLKFGANGEPVDLKPTKQ